MTTLGKRISRARPRLGAPATGPWHALDLALAGEAAQRFSRRCDSNSAPDLENGWDCEGRNPKPSPRDSQSLARHRSRSCSPPPSDAASAQRAFLRGLSSAPARAAQGAAAVGASSAAKSLNSAWSAVRRRHVVRYLLVAAMAALGLLLLLLRSAELGVTQTQEPVLGASPRRRGGAALEGLEGVGILKPSSGAGGAPWERESADTRRDWAYDDGADSFYEPWNPIPKGPRNLVLEPRNRDYGGGRRAPTWVAAARAGIQRAQRTFRSWVESDPVAELLPDGPLAWYYDWAAHGGCVMACKILTLSTHTKKHRATLMGCNRACCS